MRLSWGLAVWLVLVPPAVQSAPLVVEPASVPIGGLAIVRVQGTDVRGTFDGKPLQFHRDDEGATALIGIDLERRAGRYPIRVHSKSGDQSAMLEVIATHFPEERLTVPKTYTDLDKKTLARVRREQKVLAETWQKSSPTRLWQGAFARPAKGPSGSPFGLRRFFNGEPRSPHAGIDIRAPKGAPVWASNRGRVVLVRDLFFTGKTIAIDHGLGLFTLYVHLSKTSVAEGGVVDKGAEIGQVGATGRVTGPHLHFATRIGDARIDPDALLERPLDGKAETSR